MSFSFVLYSAIPPLSMIPFNKKDTPKENPDSAARGNGKSDFVILLLHRASQGLIGIGWNWGSFGGRELPVRAFDQLFTCGLMDKAPPS